MKGVCSFRPIAGQGLRRHSHSELEDAAAAAAATGAVDQFAI